MTWEKGLSNKVYYTIAPRSPRNHIAPEHRVEYFLKVVQNDKYIEHSAWVNYFREKADSILKAIYDKMIRMGYYGVEFISANNLQHGAFKKHLLSIIIRHALHSPQENHPEAHDETQDDAQE